MKTFFLLLPYIWCVTTSQAHEIYFEDSFDKVVYGDDNRRAINELDPVQEKETIQKGLAVFAQIPNWRIDFSTKGILEIKTRDLQSGLNFCHEEKFLDRPLVSSCTAFLVAPDLIMTAGHCIKDKYECKKQTWVLDYDDNAGFIAPNGSAFFNQEKSFQCAELVSWSNNGKLDYALIRLDRAVNDRDPLTLRRNGKIDSKESLMIIGHPLGLPKTVSDFIFIRENNLTYTFKTNADTFSGNSGSPVFGMESQLVEGMLIRGEDDFEMNLDSLCQRPKKCHDSECRGEVVLRSSVFPLKNIPKN